MTITANQGPYVAFGQATAADNNPDLGSSMFFGGSGTLDMRTPFAFAPGDQSNPQAFGWLGGPTYHDMFVVPATKSATIIAAAATVTSGTAMVLASSNATGIATGITVNRVDTGAAVKVIEIDPLVISCTASVTAGSNILTVTAMGTGTAYNPIGICPGIVLTDSTHATAIPTGTTITGYLTGVGGIGTYTMSANAVSTQTGDTVTGLFTRIPAIVPSFGSNGAVGYWNPMTMCSRTLLITASNASGVGGVFTVNGLDVYGFPMTEQITSAPGSSLTVSGLKAFKFIYSVTPGFTDGAYTYSVGTNDVIGFPMRTDNFQPGITYDVSLMMNNAAITATTGYIAAVKTTATATTGDVRGTYALQTASNGTLVYAAIQGPLVPATQSAIGLFGVPQYTAW